MVPSSVIYTGEKSMIFILITILLFTAALFFIRHFFSKIMGQAQSVYFKFERNVFVRAFLSKKLAIAKSKLDLCEKILSVIDFMKTAFCLAIIVLLVLIVFTRFSGKW